jgi:hypothetical protein
MGTLNNLNNVIKLLQQHAATIGITIAGLMVAIYTIAIMFDTDTSPTARTQRWDKLQRVLICAGIIAGTGALITLATALGKML